MALTPKPLADGQLPNAPGTLYTAPPGTIVYVTVVSFVNTSASARTINFYYKRAGGTSRRIVFAKDYQLEAGAADGHYANQKGALLLAAGDSLEGDASAASAVDYVIMGVEDA